MPLYRKRTRSYGRPAGSRRYSRRPTRRVYSRRRMGTATSIQKWGKFAHFPNVRVTRKLRNLSTELKYITIGHSGYTLLPPGDSGAPYYGLTAGRVPTNQPGSYDTLNGTLQGDDYGEREGRQINMAAIHIKGAVYNSYYAGANYRDVDQVFVALVLDTQCNGAASNSELVFSNILPAASGFSSFTCVQNPSTKKRFKVLSSRTLTLPVPVQTWDGVGNRYIGTVVPFEFFVNLKGLKVNYSIAANRTVSSIVDNCLNLYAWSMFDGATFPEQRCYLAFQSQIRFVG